MFSDLILTKSFPAAIRRVREHRRLGHRTVLITGALDVAIGPLRPLFDDILAPSLARDRKSVVSGKSVSVRVDLGGRRLIKTKKEETIKIYTITYYLTSSHIRQNPNQQ